MVFSGSSSSSAAGGGNGAVERGAAAGCAGAAGGAGGGVALRPASFDPQPPQNLSVGSTAAPQVGQNFMVRSLAR
ncbi:MAG: hypothetical protein IPH26_18830 [Sterolibacteriaceae bacterium]|uniref:Uncharacterized protein n=1 Tax=Candidatus Methylophosphatis roskildensis TaxID=2899263 RepID=A0A9D7HSR2_9PROT|nr:hypothetical protein [Candidatus Methylophosphatis roskildensis]MBK7237432.1 hypothetical protein [Sterolibacteriaceae bacterium]